ncbi:homeobox protein cut-like 1 [Bubalus kerabau]|uniref:homeobox protein cut-like 1 n=1 Tax=Bubalus bubalis TaxID=89462 RepID=UPI000DBC9F9E|nr:homeobox protein cut-like 1 [Bubalus bubalis]XP_055430473.1 homeobox protein cut-like 1 [Bubalus carabanensis]
MVASGGSAAAPPPPASPPAADRVSGAGAGAGRPGTARELRRRRRRRRREARGGGGVVVGWGRRWIGSARPARATPPAPAAALRCAPARRAGECCSGRGERDSHPRRARARGCGRAGRGREPEAGGRLCRRAPRARGRGGRTPGSRAGRSCGGGGAGEGDREGEKGKEERKREQEAAGTRSQPASEICRPRRGGEAGGERGEERTRAAGSDPWKPGDVTGPRLASCPRPRHPRPARAEGAPGALRSKKLSEEPKAVHTDLERRRV